MSRRTGARLLRAGACLRRPSARSERERGSRAAHFYDLACKGVTSGDARTSPSCTSVARAWRRTDRGPSPSPGARASRDPSQRASTSACSWSTASTCRRMPARGGPLSTGMRRRHRGRLPQPRGPLPRGQGRAPRSLSSGRAPRAHLRGRVHPGMHQPRLPLRPRPRRRTRSGTGPRALHEGVRRRRAARLPQRGCDAARGRRHPAGPGTRHLLLTEGLRRRLRPVLLRSRRRAPGRVRCGGQPASGRGRPRARVHGRLRRVVPRARLPADRPGRPRSRRKR